LDMQKNLILLDFSFFKYFLCKKVDPRHRAAYVTSVCVCVCVYIYIYISRGL
jgi:hypothetical protein